MYSTIDSFKLWKIIVTFALQRKEDSSFIKSVALESSSEPGCITGSIVPFPIVSTYGAPRREHAARPEEQPGAPHPATLPSAVAPAPVPTGLVSPVSVARARVRRPRRACSWRQSAFDATKAKVQPVYERESHDEYETLFDHHYLSMSVFSLNYLKEKTPLWFISGVIFQLIFPSCQQHPLKMMNKNVNKRTARVRGRRG